MCSFHPHGTRLVRIAGVTANSVADSVTQQARNSLSRPRQSSSSCVTETQSSPGPSTPSSPSRASGSSRRPSERRLANAIAERLVGTIRRRVLGPDARPRTSPPRGRDRRVRRALQLAPSPSDPQPARTVQVRRDACPRRRRQRRAAPTNRRLGPPHPRISTCRPNWADGFSAPTAQRASRLSGAAAHLEHHRPTAHAGEPDEVREQLVGVRRTDPVVELRDLFEQSAEATPVPACGRTHGVVTYPFLHPEGERFSRVARGWSRRRWEGRHRPSP